jgi:hypothetical protein
VCVAACECMCQVLTVTSSWCCLDVVNHWLQVCYHVGNSLSSANCEMCSSPNPEGQGFQLTEECPNCLFPNGEFAKVCEMCGTRLHLSAAESKQRF